MLGCRDLISTNKLMQSQFNIKIGVMNLPMLKYRMNFKVAVMPGFDLHSLLALTCISSDRLLVHIQKCYILLSSENIWVRLGVQSILLF